MLPGITRLFAERRYGRTWQAQTAYKAGEAAILPNGTVGLAAADFTTTSAFNAGDWTTPGATSSGLLDGGNWSVASAITQMRRGTRTAALATARVLSDGEPAIIRDGGTSRLVLGDGATAIGSLPWPAWGPAGWVDPTDPRFGAKANGRPGYQAEMSVGSAELYTPGRNGFSAADVGAIVVAVGAGPSAGPLITTVASYQAPNRITLTAASQTTISNGTFLIGHDDSAAIQAAITAAGRGGTVWLGNRGYMLASTVTTPLPVRILGGGSNYGTQILPGVAGMTMLEVGAAVVIEDLVVDGYFIAGWGIKTVAQANKIHLCRVRVEHCEAGLVFEGTQNSVMVDCYSQYNGINYYLVNGCANDKFINCNMSGDSVAISRHIVIENTADARVNGAVFAGGNRAISFFGGIMERGGAAYGVEILNATNYISFTEVELSGGLGAVFVGPGAPVPVHFNRTTFVLGATVPGIVAQAGLIRVDGISGSGWDGRSLRALIVLSGTASLTRASDSNDTPNNLLESNGAFGNGIGGWTASGAGTATWDSSGPGRLVLTSNGLSTGARCSWPGSGAIQAGQQARITFFVESITGASAVGLRLTTNAGNKALATPGSYGVGEHTVITRLDGDETGILIGATGNVSISAVIGYMTVSVF